MCGIVGYTGKRPALKVIVPALRSLEYRGYDSAGVTLATAEGLTLEKCPGRIDALEKRLAERFNGETAGVGLGHTRWATHGAPNEVNAHPHLSCGGAVALVHNGIIENFTELRRALSGHRFASETDTEMAVHLLEEELKKHEPLEALSRTVRRLRGAFALAAILRGRPGEIYAARGGGGPLVIGCGDGEMLLASDTPAVLPTTRRVIYLADGELARLTPDGVELFDFDLNARTPRVERIEWSQEQAERGGYPHFMLKEIHEQPAVAEAELTGKRDLKISSKRFNRIVIGACGTAWHAGLYGKYVIEELAGLPVDVVTASELRYGAVPFDRRTLMIAITQSGETSDTLEAARHARKHGARVLAITNTRFSSITREAHDVMYMRAGLEIGVAATKTYVSQLINVALLAIHLGGARKLRRDLAQIPQRLREALGHSDAIHDIAGRYAQEHDFPYIARRYNLPTALEGALKMKEITYLHAEGYGGGEMKHGPLAMVDAQMMTCAVAVEGSVREKMISNIREIKARSGKIVAVATEGDAEVAALADHVLTIGRIGEIFSPIPAVVPLQLLAYHTAAALGRDVDRPRNLAKSVTVE